jgi:hypothetical protein
MADPGDVQRWKEDGREGTMMLLEPQVGSNPMAIADPLDAQTLTPATTE